ncbi:MAG: serine hydrolase [Candidatus Levybacteria bacterium]|nr:serine hydrolase [Candidatus Levybacteria bacterium]
MRKIFTIVVYTFFILLIGRNMTSLPRFTLFSTPKNYAADLKKQIQKVTDKATGNYAVYFADLNKVTFAFGLYEKEQFTAASVNKVPIVATLYFLENKGKLDLDEQITIQEDDIQDYGTGTIRYQKPGSVYSLKTLAKLSLSQSDNTAAYVLLKRLGLEAVQKTMHSFGLQQTDIASNKTSPYDMFLLFKSIYFHEVTNAAKTEELLGFMKDTDTEDRLPAEISQKATVFHKTGDAIGNLLMSETKKKKQNPQSPKSQKQRLISIKIGNNYIRLIIKTVLLY